MVALSPGGASAFPKLNVSPDRNFGQVSAPALVPLRSGRGIHATRGMWRWSTSLGIRTRSAGSRTRERGDYDVSTMQTETPATWESVPRASAGSMDSAVSATTSAAFRPAWWLPSPHAQTFAGRYMRPRAAVPLERCRIGTPDGDFLDIDYAPEPAPGAPVVVLLHGLEGSTRRGYMSEMFRQLFVRGLRGVGMNFRGCGGEPNRVARLYHSGETGDLAHVVAELRGRTSRAPHRSGGIQPRGQRSPQAYRGARERCGDRGRGGRIGALRSGGLRGAPLRRYRGTHVRLPLPARPPEQGACEAPPARGRRRCRTRSGGTDTQRLRRRADGTVARFLRSRRLLRPCRRATPPPRHPGTDAPRAVP